MSVINMGTPTLNIDMGPFPPGMTGELIPNSAPSGDGITYFTEVLIPNPYPPFIAPQMPDNGGSTLQPMGSSRPFM